MTRPDSDRHGPPPGAPADPLPVDLPSFDSASPSDTAHTAWSKLETELAHAYPILAESGCSRAILYLALAPRGRFRQVYVQPTPAQLATAHARLAWATRLRRIEWACCELLEALDALNPRWPISRRRPSFGLGLGLRGDGRSSIHINEHDDALIGLFGADAAALVERECLLARLAEGDRGGRTTCEWCLRLHEGDRRTWMTMDDMPSASGLVVALVSAYATTRPATAIEIDAGRDILRDRDLLACRSMADEIPLLAQLVHDWRRGLPGAATEIADRLGLAGETLPLQLPS